jgi:hypothetical protein
MLAFPKYLASNYFELATIEHKKRMESVVNLPCVEDEFYVYGWKHPSAIGIPFHDPRECLYSSHMLKLMIIVDALIPDHVLNSLVCEFEIFLDRHGIFDLQ